MNIIVPDASVLLKWVLPSFDEKDTEKALAMRDLHLKKRIILKAPSLWIYETGNTLTRRFPDHASALLEALYDFGLQETNLDHNWLLQAVELTRQYNVTFYDAAYHVSALIEKGVFVTAEHKYAQKTKDAGGVISLEDWHKTYFP